MIVRCQDGALGLYWQTIYSKAGSQDLHDRCCSLRTNLRRSLWSTRSPRSRSTTSWSKLPSAAT